MEAGWGLNGCPCDLCVCPSLCGWVPVLCTVAPNLGSPHSRPPETGGTDIGVSVPKGEDSDATSFTLGAGEVVLRGRVLA